MYKQLGNTQYKFNRQKAKSKELKGKEEKNNSLNK